jgi:hypothetical protein
MVDFRSVLNNSPSNYNSADDKLANSKGLFLEIFHVPSEKSVKFKAFITQFDDQFQTEFAGETVFGRMDPIQVYKGTTRQISLSWDVPSASEFEAQKNLEKCSLLMNMLYPVYNTTGEQQRVMTAPPIFKLKFANLITNTRGKTPGGTAKDSGLFGTISGFSYSPDMESGFIEVKDPSSGSNKVTLLPQTISLSCMFTVVHDHPLGWKQNGEQESKLYPYGAGNAITSANAQQRVENAGEQGEKVNAAAEKNAMDSLTGGGN